MEHSWVTSKMMHAICNQLMEGGKWYKHKIAWIGDYADDLPPACKQCFEKKIDDKCCNLNVVKRMVGECGGMFKELYGLAKQVYFKFPKDFPKDYFINNHTKQEFVDISKVPTMNTPISDEDKVHPLPILTSVGNGGSGGDYDKDGAGKEFIGIWCGDSISVTLKPIDGFKEIRPNFHE